MFLSFYKEIIDAQCFPFYIIAVSWTRGLGVVVQIINKRLRSMCVAKTQDMRLTQKTKGC